MGEEGIICPVSQDMEVRVLCRLVLRIGVRSWMAALLALGQCEGKLVIAAINQMWTEEKLSDFLELFVQRGGKLQL